MQSLYNIVDGIFVSRISEEAFAATALAYPVQLLMVAVSVGSGVGINAIVSRHVGAKRYADADRDAATTVLGYVCSGLGSGMVSMLGTGLRQFLPLVPLAYLFGKLGGVGAIWYAMWISEALAVLYAMLASRRLLRTKAI